MASFRCRLSRRILQAHSRPLSPIDSSVVPRPRFNSSSAAPKRRRHVGSYVWYTLCLSIGLSAGYTLRYLIFPPSYPKPGSADDRAFLRLLSTDIDALDIVKSLRGQSSRSASDNSLEVGSLSKAGWRELDTGTSVAQNESAHIPAEGVTRTLTRKTMASAGCLGVQRAFWNPETREIVAVVWFGGAISGWPGLSHGGAIATVFTEWLSRVVAGPDVGLDSVSGPKSLSLTYARPTETNNFYILRAAFSDPTPEPSQTAPPPEPEPAKSWLPWWKDLTKKPAPFPEPTVEVSGSIENLKGKVCVRAKAVFSPVSTQLNAP